MADTEGMEIVEEGISLIAVAISDVFCRRDKPLNGWAKWFRDELGQLWVKYSTAQGEAVYQHVIPASRVREVQYRKQ